MTTNSFETWQQIAGEVDLLLRLPNGQRVFREQARLAADQAVERRRVEYERADYDDEFSDGPLPVPTRMLDTCEKFAVLSAIHDAYLKGIEKVAPWGTSANQKAVLSGLPESDVPEDQYRQATWYYLLVHAAGKLDTDEIPTVASWLSDVESRLATDLSNADFLGITLGDHKASRVVDGKVLETEFNNKRKPWMLFRELYCAGVNGLSRKEIAKRVWPPDGNISDNNLDQNKRAANDLLERLRIEIVADNRGVWRLACLDS